MDIDYAKAYTMVIFNPSQWTITNWLSIDSETSDPDKYRNLLTAARNSPSLKGIIEKYLSDTKMSDRTFPYLKNFMVTQWTKAQTTV